MRPSYVLALGLLVVFAGCTGAKAAPESTTTANSVVQVSSDSTGDGGSVSGIVTDDALSPLSGADVAIQGQTAKATTDSAGTFAFQNLPAGNYVLVAAKLGYAAGSARVTVAGGEEAKAKLVLAPVAVSQAAYIDLVQKQLHVSCGLGLVVVTGSVPCAPFGDPIVTADINVTKDVKSAVGELTWAQNSGFSSKAMRLTSGSNESGGNLPTFANGYDDQTGSSPVRNHKDAPFKGITGNDSPPVLRYRIWVPFQTSDPPVVILVFDQKFTLYSSTFYGESAPDGYTALPDS